MSVTGKIYATLKGDRIIWFVIILLAIFSLLAVYSSTGTIAYKHKGGYVEYYLIRQFIILAAGLALTYFCCSWHYMNYSRLAPFLLILSIVLLLYTLVAGAEINDARRWIATPFGGLTFQTSDLAKLGLIVYLARSISSKQGNIKDFKEAFVPIILPVVIVCGLIAPADLSTAGLLFMTCVLMMYIGRMSSKYIAAILVSGFMMLSVLIVIGTFAPDIVRLDTWVNRVQEFRTNVEGGYQVREAKIAIANGEWLGVGPGKSNQRNYLPSPYSDFIYAIVCEEYGLIGAGFIMILYMILLFRCIRLVTVSPKAFGSLLAIGLGISIVTQALANMAVTAHLMPVTGLTLPLISMGGTSIIFTCIMFGIILSVSKYIEKVA